MKTHLIYFAAIGVLTACTAPAETSSPMEMADDKTPSEQMADPQQDDARTLPPTTPLQDIIESGDYNNDALPETEVPNTGTVIRDVPQDEFLERVESRGTDPEPN